MIGTGAGELLPGALVTTLAGWGTDLAALEHILGGDRRPGEKSLLLYMRQSGSVPAPLRMSWLGWCHRRETSSRSRYRLDAERRSAYHMRMRPSEGNGHDEDENVGRNELVDVCLQRMLSSRTFIRHWTKGQPRTNHEAMIRRHIRTYTSTSKR